jgi:hypothetical protein
LLDQKTFCFACGRKIAANSIWRQLLLIFFALISFNSEQPILLVQRLFSALQLPDAFQLA